MAISKKMTAPPKLSEDSAQDLCSVAGNSQIRRADLAAVSVTQNRAHEIRILEQIHRDGYERFPVARSDFEDWEDEQAWVD